MTLHRQTVVVGPIDTNCYVLSHPITKQAIVIDPGMECAPILAALQGLKLTDILLTHAHFDHMGGVAQLVAATGARIWLHEQEADWLSSPTRNLSAMTRYGECVAPPADVLLLGGEVFEVLGEELQVLHTPGHTPGHVAYRMGGIVFVGDLIFAGSVGRTDFPGGSFKTLLQSIRMQILSLPPATLLLPGHGEPTTVERESTYNPYIRD